MTSEVAIANRALQMIGTRSTIASLTENSNEARNFNLIYADTRDEVLSMAFWNFATKTALLSLIKSAPGTPTNPTASATVWTPAYPAPPWLYEYAYNSDCIQMRAITGQYQYNTSSIPIMSNAGASYLTQMSGQYTLFVATSDADADGNPINVILTNQYQAIGVYTQRITNTALFSSQFVQALVAACAAKMAQSLTGDKDLSKTLFAMANAFIVAARASDGNEGLTIIDNEASWILARDNTLAALTNGYYVAGYNSLFMVV